jgi:hypothetical protein
VTGPGLRLVATPDPALGRLAFRLVGDCAHGHSEGLLFGQFPNINMQATNLHGAHRQEVGCACPVTELVVRQGVTE